MNFTQIRMLNRLSVENVELKEQIAALIKRVELLEQKPKRGRPRKNAQTN